MEFIILLAIALLLEFAVEPIFKIRERMLKKFGGVMTGIIAFLVTASIYVSLVTFYPDTFDTKLFPFIMLILMLHFIPLSFSKKKGV